MEIIRILIISIYVVLCLVLVVLITKQSKEDSGASGTVMGASASNFYEKNKGRTKEEKLKKITIALAVVFVILNIVLGILYVV